MKKIKWVLGICVVITLFYTRFVGLTWGLPYPFHPDERNIAVAASHLTPANFFKPDFFAYGQLTIYGTYLFSVLQNILMRHSPLEVTAEQATLWLRFVSAIAGVFTVYIALKIVSLFTQNSAAKYITVLLFIFSPALIQFAHFGTTESVLMMLYTALVYSCMLLMHAARENRVKYFLLSSALVGIAAAAKVSSLAFAALPIGVFIFTDRKNVFKNLLWVFLWGEIVLIVMFIFSPYTFVSWKEFISSLRYESAVATGATQVFYTRPFFMTPPVTFQFINVFPYALGWPVFALFMAGFLFLPWKRNYNLLRAAFLIYFLPQAFLFAKWTRFIAPIFPVMIITSSLSIVLIDQFIKQLPRWAAKLFIITIVLVSIVPGVAYLAIYQHEDVRFQASEWIFKNIPEDAYILSETANVVDLPISPPNSSPLIYSYKYVSFNFYDLDANKDLQKELTEHLTKADYIFVLSRRLFANHTCEDPDQKSKIKSQKCPKLQQKYPKLNVYYSDLFSGKSGFKKVAEFTSYPQLFGWEFPDEAAEETWTVFDHPVVRIYKRT